MSNYPPTLVGFSETDFGSVLVLDDHTQVSINVRPARLTEALIEYGRPALVDLINSRSLGVFVGPLNMSTEQWDRISDCIRSSKPAANAFGRFPAIWTCFGEPHGVLLAELQ